MELEIHWDTAEDMKKKSSVRISGKKNEEIDCIGISKKERKF